MCCVKYSRQWEKYKGKDAAGVISICVVPSSPTSIFFPVKREENVGRGKQSMAI